LGNYPVRQWKRECKWTDKTAKRHKHIFDVHAVAQLRNPNGYIDCFDVMKCRDCNSFKCIPSKGSMHGLLDEVDESLPKIKLFTPHKWLIGFKDVVLDDNDDSL
jgi:hypothetical protein